MYHCIKLTSYCMIDCVVSCSLLYVIILFNCVQGGINTPFRVISINKDGDSELYIVH